MTVLKASSDGRSLEGVLRNSGFGYRKFRLVLSPDKADFDGVEINATTGEACYSLFTGYSEERRQAAHDSAEPTPTPAPAPAPAPDINPEPTSDPQQGPVSPTPTPVPVPLPPAPAPAPTTGFQSLTKYDVRVDRVVVARDAQRIDVFVTLKNPTSSPLYATSGALMVRLEDSDGVGKVNGQILRPTPEGRTHFASTPAIEPGGELKAKYSFHPDAGASPARVTISEGDKRASFGV
ncbi:hypothetical protein [Qipengyuania atrilutea]|uniref:Uncharacterized protein n=1 Tax=Qipengyuania atrilutea TaxID=2744473 RepID=A0A850H5H1_9SPHN|nr:hypothetical protein [Actirhodobacter atriluteus]NVD45920.1 hypothetical protein [Actirhodobacter atriluteus]